MLDWLAVQAEQRPEAACLVFAERVTSFGQMDEQVARAAGALRATGLRKGDRVAVWGANDPSTVRAMWAIPRAGAVLVPLNTRLTEREAAWQASDAAVSLLLGHPDRPYFGLPSLDFDALDEGDPIEPEPAHADTPHSVVYTSGTSGIPRGAILSWANLEAAAAASAKVLDHGPNDRWLAVMPLHHVGGLAILIRSAREGGCVVLESLFEAARVAARLRHDRISLVSLVPTMLERVLRIDTGPFPHLRAVLLGGGPVPETLLIHAAEAGVPVLTTYGLTEAASQVATAPLSDALIPHKGVAPITGLEMRIVDAEGREVPRGASGRVEIRGPMVSSGYLHGPQRDLSEWFATGDLGEMDADHHLTIIGREDDVIVTGGENVHPIEVEEAFRDHPGVREVAVFGVPDPEWGQVVAVRLVAPDVGQVELDGFLRTRLAGYKIPRRWRFVDELPRTSIGKLERRRLAAEEFDEL